MQHTWTVLFYIFAEDASTASYASMLLKELKASKDGPGLILLVFESKYRGDDDQIMGTLYQLAPNAATGIRDKQIVKDFGVVNPGNADVLESVLSTIRTNRLLPDKFLLFTWDHGAGFGIFDGDPRPGHDDINFIEQPDKIQFPVFGMNFPVIPDNGRQVFKVIANKKAAAVGGANIISHNDTPGRVSFNAQTVAKVNMLTIGEINQALKTLGKKTELVIMLNCWMQMLETGLELSETVEILVASETANFFAGYDYTTILKQIADDPGSTGEKIAEVAIATIPARYKQKKSWGKNLKDLAISVTRPSISVKLVEALTKICKTLEGQLADHYIELKRIRGRCTDLTLGYFTFEDGRVDSSLYDCYIDPLNFLAMTSVMELLDPAELISLANITSQEYILKSFCGTTFNQPGPVPGILGCNGYSIYFPNKKVDFDSVYYDYFYADPGTRTKLAAREWGKFLRKYRTKEDR